MFRRSFFKLSCVAAAALYCCVSATTFACDDGFGEDENRPKGAAIRYLGLVADKNGKALPNATILVSTLGAEFKADRKGRFLHSFNFESDAPSIIFICKQNGYKSSQAIKKKSPSDPNIILLSCAMQPEG